MRCASETRPRSWVGVGARCSAGPLAPPLVAALLLLLVLLLLSTVRMEARLSSCQKN